MVLCNQAPFAEDLVALATTSPDELQPLCTNATSHSGPLAIGLHAAHSGHTVPHTLVVRASVHARARAVGADPTAPPTRAPVPGTPVATHVGPGVGRRLCPCTMGPKRRTRSHVSALARVRGRASAG